MNKVIISGRVATDIEIKTFGENQKGSFRFALSERKGKDKQTNFVNVEVWNKSADIVKQFAPKGSFLVIEGRLEQNLWKTEAGENRERLLVVADNVELGPKTEAGEPAAAAASGGGDDGIF